MDEKVRIDSSKRKYVLQSLEDMRRKLLDRTVRNKLLNFPINQNLYALRIINTSPNQLYQQIFREDVMKFATIPMPTRKEIQEYNLSSSGDFRPIDEQLWADRLCVNVNYDLPMEYKFDDEENNYETIKRVRDVVIKHIKENNSLININDLEGKIGFSLNKLTSIVQNYGYKDLEDFQCSIRDGSPLKPRHFQIRLSDNQIQTFYFPDNLDVVLRSINEKSQSSIRETGTSILYIVLGFLEWYEADDYENPRLAPLFTIPVSLEKGNLASQPGISQYHLRYTGEEILLNLSLKEKLQSDFGIILPPITEGMWPEDYFIQIQDIIDKSKSHWAIRRYGVLGLLNFSKMLMCLDLDYVRWPEGKDSILNHEIIQRLFIAQSSDNDKDTIGSNKDTEYKIDEIEDIHHNFPLIDDADSSQHSALIDVINGKNLVIEGPPGTGKSQTITNIIATAMLHGKKVLFCAQKMAAIEVVKQRLAKAGLGDFCLELHSHKAHKRAVIEDLRKIIDNRNIKENPKEIDTEIARYEELKLQLNCYAHEINQIWKKSELTINQILMRASRYRCELKLDPAQLHIKGLSGENADRLYRSRLEDQVKTFKDSVMEFHKQAGENMELTSHPWYGVHSSEIHVLNYRNAISSLRNWQSTLIDWQKNYYNFMDRYAITDKMQHLLCWQEQLLLESDKMPVLSKSVDFEAFKKFDDESIASIQKWIDDFNHIRDNFSNIKPYLFTKKLDDLRKFDDVPVFADLCKEFGISADISLGDISVLISSLQEIMASCDKYWALFSELIQNFPPSFSKNIVANRQGFQNIVLLMDLAVELPVSLLRYRDSLFDNDAIDSTLEELSERLDSLKVLQESLRDIFKIKKLPSAEVLQRLNKELHSSGLFSSFNASWKNAKKSLLELAKNPSISWKSLYANLPSAYQFVVERDKLEKRNFGNILGEHYQGLGTDVIALQKIRNWYRRVRQVWRDNPGLSVVPADRFLIIDSQLFKGIQKLQSDGLSKKITSVLDSILEIEKILPQQKVFQDLSAMFIGENNIFIPIIKRLSDSFSPLQAWFKGDDIILRDAKEIGQQLHTIQKQRFDLEERSVIISLFGKDVRPSVINAYDKETSRCFAIINSTLEFANSIKQNVLFDALLIGISHVHDRNSYNNLLKDLKNLKNIWQKQIDKRELFIQDTQLDISQWISRCDDNLVKLIARNEDAVNKPRWLNGWINLMHMVQDMQDNGLHSIQEAVFDNTIGVKQLESCLLAVIYNQLAHEIFTDKPHLMHYSGVQFSAKQKRFREYDKSLQLHQRTRIASVIGNQKIIQGISGGRKSDYTELSLIRSELGKKARNIPIRQLISRAKNSLLQLKPCFMMSPMSVASYLEPGDIQFDLVIMDESSQIKPEDALGVIARGKQIVVVGDPKQLPPTRFFDHDSDDQEDYDEDIAAVSQTESILDALLPLFSMRRLQWHYRSLNENLIACSNYHFYDNDLIVFPSPYTNADMYGIDFTHIKNGKMIDQCNPEEAKVIALAVKEHAIKYPQESLGVVAMNAKQRDQIENAINKLCRNDIVVEQAISKLRVHRDPFFVKNLENVQGDERDTIFISFTYGPSEAGGRVFQRFGPINSDIGWRRLNVMFTRARKRINVFSTMRYLDVLVDIDSKRGVRVMRDFLRFAETGFMEHSSKDIDRKQDTDFAVSVMAKLKKEGFSCDSQLGNMGFSLDVAVRDPSNPGQYLMGIECDGAVYNSAKSARDRDRLRQEVLERMGWKIRRIWSVDWFTNPDEAIDPIIRELRQYIKH
ncbi:DUF4011 domain-containing anti-phage protein Hhe [Candidatus Liberibacter americanus]|uniref:Superfamily I DNA and RNA helicase n=1 Tax=Candidatus Liberibacter americanus str. Sao Paulo TaxID=1261131 RepID=U6B5U0_9HYPH|nr:DUF4011 domain-containing anti-phage protein Hhe [Candidatus Liberibacter americanus]AHA28243.1 Superfamily I DNA and RNA helicase [Candidatus Liberibacter americanus str. Sao Paulo]EMS36243.1 hypothetical protein G653_02419 [Candidatus Liberibacter americanus PW_SP]